MTAPEPTKGKIRVMLVDDSAVIRGFVTKILESQPDIEIVASCQNGQAAVSAISGADPDVIILDVEMPIMDGLTAIPELLAKKPCVPIIMCSTLTTKNGATTLKAMSLGAMDCIAKPTSTQEIYGQDEFRTVLLSKIRLITAGIPRKPAPATPDSKLEDRKVNLHPHLPKVVTLRPPQMGWQGKPAIVAIGSSTGGPNALFKVLAHCKGFDVPIVVTQHMPPTFTKILAEHIQQQTGVETFEASEGMRLEAGKIYVAQGGHHMLIRQTESGEKVIHIDSGPMENFCKPAVDPMIRSLTSIYKERILMIVLTGMGTDGLKGGQEVVNTGGRVIAQNEATSVVWGMPGAVALAGICSAVLPLEEIGPYIRKAVLRL